MKPKKTKSEASYLKVGEQELCLSELSENLPNLKKIEIKIIQARTNYLSFIQISEADRKNVLGEIVKDVVVNFGFDEPKSDSFYLKMISNLERFILHSGYGHLTEGEFALCQIFNMWPKSEQPDPIDFEQVVPASSNFNISFFSKLLINYCAVRNNLDKKFYNFLNGIGEHGFIN